MARTRDALIGLAVAAGAGAVLLGSGIALGARGPAEKGQGDKGPALVTEPAGPVGMPSGILLKIVRIGEAIEVAGSSSSQPQEYVVFATDQGRALYTFAKDSPGQPSACADAACAALWPAAVAPEGAQGQGDWSIVARQDGVRQWAFRGMPLYTYAKDVAATAERVRGPAGAEGHGADGLWQVAEVAPERWTVRPTGIGVGEALMAPGRVLVTERRRTIYAFAGDVKADKALLKSWVPVAAAQLDLPVGDFSVLARGDGLNQWAWRGKALYTFRGDIEEGDLNGSGLVAGMEPAVVLRYFKPAEVAIAKDQRRGGLLVEASTGRTLYARDRVMYNGTGSHYGRGLAKGTPTIGAAIGLTGCDSRCEQTWKPLLASADARSTGSWTVIARPDGTRQWAYQSYALYTNQDERPGEVGFHDAYDIELNHDPAKPVAAAHGFALYWRAAPP